MSSPSCRNILPRCSWLLFLLFSFQWATAQNITYQTSSRPLIEILKDLSEQSDVYFSYSNELMVPLNASLSVSEMPIEQVLFTLLDPFDLQAKRSRGNYFIIQTAFRSIKLIIQDEETGDPLPYSLIKSLQTRRGAFANQAGIASLAYDRREDSTILVHHLGYSDQVITLTDQMPEEGLIRLRADSSAIEEVLIEYQNAAITLKEGAQFQISPSRMKVLPGLAENDIMLTLEILPGLESSDETASGINVRGGGSDQLMVYWDRIPVYKQAHFFGTLTSFIPSTIDNIQAFKNFIPAQYTGSTSGLVDIRLPEAVPSGTEVAFRTNLTHSDLMIHIPILKNLSVLAAGRVSFHDQFNTPTFDSHRNKLFAGTRQEDFLAGFDDEEDEEDIPVLTDQMSLFYSDLNAKLIYEISDQDFLSVSLMRNQDQFYFDASTIEDAYLTERNHDVAFLGVNALYERIWDEKWKSSLSFTHADYLLENRDLRVFEDSTERNEILIQNALLNRELKLMNSYQVSSRSVIDVGYQFNSYQNFFSLIEELAFEEEESDTLEAMEGFHGIFARYHYSRDDRIDIQPQFRIDWFPGLDQLLVNPVLTAHFKILPTLWLKSSLGQYVQAVRSLQEGELDVSNVSEGIWFLSEQGQDPEDGDDLPLLRSQQLTIGGLFKQDGWLVDLDVYWKNTEGLSSLNQFSRETDVGFSIGESRAIGLDLMARKTFGRYQTWMSYSLSRVSNRFEDLTPEFFPSTLDRPHQFRWVHTVYVSPIEVSIGWILRSGSPYTEAVGLVFIPEDDPDPDPDPEDGYYEIQYGPINGQRLPLYHRLDLSVWYKFGQRKGPVNGQIGLSIQNLYNRENVWQRFFFLEDIDEDVAPEIVEEERFFLGFTPNLSVQLSF